VGEDDDSFATRRPRADALRNRALLLDTAKIIFAAKGSETSLDEIAKAAGVGIGTLYRHFPTRDSLIEAVYRKETGQLAEAAAQFADEHPPIEALRAWMGLFVDHLAAKQVMVEMLNSLVGGTSDLYATSGALVQAALSGLLERGIAAGEIRPLDMDPLDLLRAVAGVANITAGPDWKRNAKQMADILIAGLRP
jgi:AcrR family transcriptional regulator